MRLEGRFTRAALPPPRLKHTSRVRALEWSTLHMYRPRMSLSSEALLATLEVEGTKGRNYGGSVSSTAAPRLISRPPQVSFLGHRSSYRCSSTKKGKSMFAGCPQSGVATGLGASFFNCVWQARPGVAGDQHISKTTQPQGNPVKHRLLRGLCSVFPPFGASFGSGAKVLEDW